MISRQNRQALLILKFLCRQMSYLLTTFINFPSHILVILCNITTTRIYHLRQNILQIFFKIDYSAFIKLPEMVDKLRALHNFPLLMMVTVLWKSLNMASFALCLSKGGVNLRSTLWMLSIKYTHTYEHVAAIFESKPDLGGWAPKLRAPTPALRI